MGGAEMKKKESIMAKNDEIQETTRINALFERISALIEQSRSVVVYTAKAAEAKTRYEVGRYIFEDEQQDTYTAESKMRALAILVSIDRVGCLTTR